MPNQPIHPGVLLREFLVNGTTITSMAKSLKYPRANLSLVINGKLGISPRLALKLESVYPNQNAEFWLSMQTKYDLHRLRNGGK